MKMKVTVELTLTVEHVQLLSKLIQDRVEALKPTAGWPASAKELEALEDITTAFEAAELNIRS